MPSQARLLLAERLRLLRFQRRWSQEELAAQSGLHRTYIGSIERARTNLCLENIERLAQALDVSIAELFATRER